jgi:hypothetical protein
MEEVYESLHLDTVRWPDLQQCVCEVTCIVTSLFLAVTFSYLLEAEHLSHYFAIKLLIRRVLYAMSRDKDVRTCVRTIVGVAAHDHIHFAQVFEEY